MYSIPEEQQDLAKSVKIFQKMFFNKNVFEIACGTGYWTEQISRSAASVFATDINENVIEIAKERKLSGNVTFEVADLFEVKTNFNYDALFGGFIWSHILIEELDNFLNKVTKPLKSNSTIAFIDSRHVRDGFHDLRSISKTDENGNTFQIRTLENGMSYQVLKNFPSEEFLVQKLSRVAHDINYIELEHYWIASCILSNLK